MKSIKRPPPVCKALRPWLRGHCDTAGLTGQDSRALNAFVHLVELYACSDGTGADHALDAMRHAALAMQPSMRHLAKRSIPHVMDWGDEGRIWSLLFPQGHQGE